MALPRKALPTDFSFGALFGANTEYRYFEHAEAHPFRARATYFDLRNAWWMAEMSMLAYVRDREFVAAQLEAAGFPGFRAIDGGGSGAQGFIAYSDDVIVVCFRGTEIREPADVFTDLKFLLVDSGQGGRVHQGFKEAVDSVWPAVRDILASLGGAEGNGRRLWMTGHSLGGGMAVLAADRLGSVQGVYTYGAPRTGDRRFRNDYYARTYRVVHNNDIVPKVPPRVPYRHVGQCRFIDDNGDVDDNPRIWRRARSAFAGWGDHLMNTAGAWREGSTGQIPLDAVADHALMYYVAHLWNAYADTVD